MNRQVWKAQRLDQCKPTFEQMPYRPEKIKHLTRSSTTTYKRYIKPSVSQIPQDDQISFHTFRVAQNPSQPLLRRGHQNHAVARAAGAHPDITPWSSRRHQKPNLPSAAQMLRHKTPTSTTGRGSGSVPRGTAVAQKGPGSLSWPTRKFRWRRQ